MDIGSHNIQECWQNIFVRDVDGASNMWSMDTVEDASISPHFCMCVFILAIAGTDKWLAFLRFLRKNKETVDLN